MDYQKLIGIALERKKAAEAQRSAFTQEQRSMVDALGENASLTETDQARFDALSTQKRTAGEQIDQFTAEIEQLRAAEAEDKRFAAEAEQTRTAADAPATGTQAARTQAREGTYSKRKAQQEGVSFFSDLYRQQSGLAGPEISARLQAHTLEARESGQLSERALGTGNLGGLVPPAYLVEEAALLARAGRPTANVVRHLPLPPTGMSIVIPRGTSGTSTAIQATQNTAVSNTDLAIADLTVPVVTIAGQQDVSRQSLERGEGVDSLIFADLAASYAVSLDAQVIAGTGSAGQMLGILNTAGVTQMSAFTAAVTATTFYKKLAGAIVAIQTGRFLAPSGVVMHPRRWGWLSAEVDASGRPLVVPNTNGPMNAFATHDGPLDTPLSTPVGWIQGVPIYTDANLPVAVGTGPEDQVIVARLEDLLLWEDGDGTPQQLRFEQTTGGSLTVKLVAYGYAAFTAGRYPLATAILGGNAAAGFGLAAPTF
jgi:HK97 family phage major capsid protein